MSNKFTEMAKASTEGLSTFITKDREKRTNEQMLASYPKGFTIIGAEIYHGVKDGKEYDTPRYIVKEDSKIFANGGKALADIVRKWVEGYEGDFEKMSADLEKSGGVKVKLTPTKTKDGKPFTAIEILD